MEIVRKHIVYKQDFIGGKFVKVVETSDGKYFREMGGSDAFWAHYSHISKSTFREMQKDYLKKVGE